MQQFHDFDSIQLDRVERERIARLHRAGVRHRPADVAPTSAFIAVETAVLVMVAALAMTSIIITAGDPEPVHERIVARAADAAPKAAATSASDGVRHARCVSAHIQTHLSGGITRGRRLEA